MKYYFMSWETETKEGDACWNFPEDINPREALKEIRAAVIEQFNLDTVLVVKQFNNVS
jgi:hypothetical protein